MSILCSGSRSAPERQPPDQSRTSTLLRRPSAFYRPSLTPRVNRVNMMLIERTPSAGRSSSLHGPPSPDMNGTPHAPSVGYTAGTPSVHELVPKLSYSNFSFWLQSLRLAAGLYGCEEYLGSDTPSASSAGAAQAWLLVTASIPADMRHQLTTTELAGPPGTLVVRLRALVTAHPSNDPSFLATRAAEPKPPRMPLSRFLAAQDEIRQRMVLTGTLDEDDESIPAGYIAQALSSCPEYAAVCSRGLLLGPLRHALLAREQALGHGHRHRRRREHGREHGQGHVTQKEVEVEVEGGGDRGAEGNTHSDMENKDELWCSFHNVSTHSTEECVARVRLETKANRVGRKISGGKWCSLHGSGGHDSSECKAKARLEGGKWCSFHRSPTHNTGECEAKRRVEATAAEGEQEETQLRTTWCSFHECHSHDTKDCLAKARYDKMPR